MLYLFRVVIFFMLCVHAMDGNAAYSIPELIDLALKNNPETQAAWWSAQKAADSEKAVQGAYYPSLRLRGSASDGRDYKYPTGQEINYTSIDGSIILCYLLYDFGERCAAGDVAKAALLAARWQSDWTLQKTMLNVLTQAYIFLNAQEMVLSRQASLKDAALTLEAAEELNRVGLRSVNDVYAIRAAISDLQMGIAWQKAEADVARGKLASVLGMDMQESLEIEPLPEPPADPIVQQGLNDLIALAKRQRADILAKLAELEAKRALERKTKAKYLPKLNFNADTGYKRYVRDRANGFHYNLIFSFDAPLFSGFESIYQTRAACAEVQMSASEVEKLELEIALEVLTYSRMFEAAREVLGFAMDNLQNSFKTFEGVLQKYKAGMQSIFDLTAAQHQLADARLKYGEAKTRWYKSLAQLAFSSGTLTPFSEVICVRAD